MAEGPLLNPQILIIGFSRRFASYKRADLIFHDHERLKAIVGVDFSTRRMAKEYVRKFYRDALDHVH